MEKEQQPKIGDLRVWWIPQVPMEPFRVSVQSLREAKLLNIVLADYDIFQLENNIKPDYCNAGGVEVYEEDDGSGSPGWCEWSSSDGDEITDIELENTP